MDPAQLRDELTQADVRRRMQALREAHGARAPGLADLAVELLPDDPDPRMRLGLARVVARHGGPAHAWSLTGRLGERDPAVRRAIVEAIGRAGDAQVHPYLVHTLGNDPDPAVRDAAAAAVMGLGRDAVLQLFERMVESPQEWMRIGAVRAMGLFNSPMVVPLMGRAGLRGSGAVRREAGEGLARLGRAGVPGAAEAATLLAAAEHDPSPVPAAAAQRGPTPEPTEEEFRSSYKFRAAAIRAARAAASDSEPILAPEPFDAGASPTAQAASRPPDPPTQPPARTPAALAGAPRGPLRGPGPSARAVACPFCHEAVEEEPVTCTGCRAIYHTSCLGYSGCVNPACPVKGQVQKAAPAGRSAGPAGALSGLARPMALVLVGLVIVALDVAPVVGAVRAMRAARGAEGSRRLADQFARLGGAVAVLAGAVGLAGVGVGLLTACQARPQTAWRICLRVAWVGYVVLSVPLLDPLLFLVGLATLGFGTVARCLHPGGTSDAHPLALAYMGLVVIVLSGAVLVVGGVVPLGQLRFVSAVAGLAAGGLTILQFPPAGVLSGAYHASMGGYVLHYVMILLTGHATAGQPGSVLARSPQVLGLVGLAGVMGAFWLIVRELHGAEATRKPSLL